MKISNHFTLKEVEHSDTAKTKGIENICTGDYLDNARYTASRLDYIRNCINLPFVVTSWFRSFELNKAVGGSDKSAHKRGLAVDFRTKSNNMNVYQQIINLKSQNKISFDQCYYDPKKNFIHIAFCRNFEDERGMSWIK